MFYFDLLKLAFANLFRSRLRTILTILGVVIGIGALTSMISFGTGIQKNITDTFKSNEIFTTLIATSAPLEFNMDKENAIKVPPAEKDLRASLNDSSLLKIRAISGVIYAYPEVTFPSRIEFGTMFHNSTVQALPSVLGKYKPYNQLLAGSFFSSDSASEAVIRWETLRDMKIIVKDIKNPYILSSKDSASGVQLVEADSILGRTIKVISANFNAKKIITNPMNLFSMAKGIPLGESVTEIKICGILKRSGTFGPMAFKGGIILPPYTASLIPRLGFSSVWDLLDQNKREDQYSAIHIRVSKIDEIDPVRKKIKKMGLQTYAIVDELDQMKRGFLLMDSILAAVGTIALIVAALGIINTMLMSILERTREIGIMKAIGGSEKDIRLIFFAEAAAIGLLGAAFGLLLGWGVTKLANYIANTSILPVNELPVNLFWFPAWLIAGAVAFSIVISLIAGLYPAIRAARIDPVKALRHD
jgi:putative ABC transport system permease protein